MKEIPLGSPSDKNQRTFRPDDPKAHLRAVHAFEIETKLRKMIEVLIYPVVTLSKENSDKLVEMRRYLEHVRVGQQELNDKLENT